MPDTEREHVERVLRRWRAADSHKDFWLQHWEDLARVMVPRRLGFVSQVNPGQRNTEEIFDGTAMRAARGLANAMAQMLRPEGEQWFFIRAAEDVLNEIDEARAWLADSEQKLMDAMFNPKARFRQAVGEADLDLVVLGTCVLFIGRSRNLRHLTFQTMHLKNSSVAYDDEGNPDTLFNSHWFTLRQAELKFGRENLSEQTRRKLDGKDDAALEEKARFLHAVTPRPNGDPDALFARNLPFAEEWIELDAKKRVQEAGFHEFPFAVGRWDTSSGENYGRSPGMIALPDAQTSQAMGETILVAGQRQADPPLFAPNDGSFDALNTIPGGIAYYDVETAQQLRGNPFFPLETGGNLPISRDMQQDVREQIEAAFFKNVFNLPVEGPQMTATEILERKEEFIREIGPVFGRLESDYLAPIVERAFAIMLRAGSFAPVPEVLQGQDVRFEYESPVKKIREQAEAAAARLWATEMFEYSQFKEEAADLVNIDGLGRFGAQALNLPQQVVTPREEVEQIRQQRAEAQQAQAEALALQNAAEIANTGGQAARNITEAARPDQGAQAA